LMVKCYLNKIMEFKCNTYIILGYLHSPWNMERYCKVQRGHIDGIKVCNTPKPYTINVTNIAIPSCTYTNDFALVHLWVWKCLSTIFNFYLNFLT
jgi:hypothetical protein